MLTMKFSLLFLFPLFIITLLNSCSNKSEEPGTAPFFHIPKVCVLKSKNISVNTRILPPQDFFNKTASSQFTINFLGAIPADVQTAVEYASSIWEQLITSDVPVEVDVLYFDLGAGTLGVCIPNARNNFPFNNLPETFYPISLANKISGYDLDTAHADMLMYISSTANFYTDTDGNCPPNKIDLVSVALHEFGHGLGFADSYKIENTLGSFGMFTSSDLPPLTFPFYDLEKMPFIYSHFVQNDSAQELLDSSFFPNPSTYMADLFTSNQVYFNGPFVLAANNNLPLRLYAPGTWDQGSSMVHLNELTYPEGNPNSLMTPFIANGEVEHLPGDGTLALLNDIGWNNFPTDVAEPALNISFSCNPNPFADGIEFHFENTNSLETVVSVYDVNGSLIRKIISSEQSIHWNGTNQYGEEIVNGIYFAKLQSGNQLGILKLIKVD